ncbi:YqfO family protein [Marinobacter sp. X15-166B]|uniref:Nif3-like dinuclear metal center hexameric protein n=1 Tax=Marinobacter sp. X15-166B TaxID=1897620 RepID=UPI00085BC21A|nr:YqfO family protein [Marinobacter sp. X15-166B]OEY65016.1 NGG1p interacting factor NIF3 [Marinobacter sp. X15-166B]
MYKICFFVPERALETTKQALFDAGAGRIGDYDRCAWQVLGQGQFRPLQGSQPHIGSQDHLEVVSEYRVEMVCESAFIRQAVAALKAAHPYEEPAYEVYRLESL